MDKLIVPGRYTEYRLSTLGELDLAVSLGLTFGYERETAKGKTILRFGEYDGLSYENFVERDVEFWKVVQLQAIS